MNDRGPGLYVVGTPIGNLGDLSERAREVLSEAQIVAAEDTRTAATLLRISHSSARTISLTEHNVEERIPALLEAARNAIVAIVSDAGTPVIADPGARLVEAAHEAGVAVFAIPGPSALTAAISVSGFPGLDVHFLGFLPRPKGERLARLQTAAQAAGVLVFFESPNRLAQTLQEIAEALGDPLATVSRELTKLHEETVRGHASELASRFTGTRGECTVAVLVPGREPADDLEEEALGFLGSLKRAEARRSPAAAETARRYRIDRQRAYELWDRA